MIESLQMFEQDEVRVTFGVHPHFADEVDQAVMSALRHLLSGANVVALGEIGLDQGPKTTSDFEVRSLSPQKWFSSE